MRLMTPLLVLCLSAAQFTFGAAPAKPATRPAAPTIDLRVAKADWGGADLGDVKKVFLSVSAQLLPHFPGAKLEPIRVEPRGGPIVLFNRTKEGLIVVRLDTGGNLWAQYAFQFAHELCHVLSRYEELDTGQKWLEESLCELSSLYTLRSMAKQWETKPPYPNWKPYAKHLAEYAQERIDKHPLPEGKTLAQWYADNAEPLGKTATDRERNTVAAVALLPLFEKEPDHWMAVYYLNQNKPKQGKQTLRERLQNWHDETPAEHRPFVRAIARQFGIELDEKR
jgi:hypothetical protein